MSDLSERIERLFDTATQAPGEEHFRAVDELRQALNEGRARAAEPAPGGEWRVNA
ncbi:MAG: 2,3,4,5-tetrahydropyridine-2,6-dicarboxylate N-succinyltransferase, partial [Acidobacteriota bacterium]|nr:2,3,4,5-tetrahydropyridine-2,6-dicarboxylate N-succinyltransferase [Acidobacteriota bacterium]